MKRQIAEVLRAARKNSLRRFKHRAFKEKPEQNKEKQIINKSERTSDNLRRLQFPFRARPNRV